MWIYTNCSQDLASNSMPIGQFFEEAEVMAAEHPEDNIDDMVIR